MKKILDLEINLPDFASPSVLLRVAIAANICLLVGAVIRAPGLPFSSVYALFADSALTGEPVLMLTLLTLTLAWPRCKPNVRSLFAVFAAPFWAAMTTAFFSLWDLTYGDWISSSIQALISSLILCLYFDWRHRRLSPALSEARLTALQARIRPHFFFNAINGITTLLMRDPEAAEESLLDLADLFRELMKESSAWSKIEHEIELTEKYLRIEQMRFRERLTLDLHIDPSAKGAYIPALLIQPLAENGIIHGIEIVGSGVLKVRAYAEKNKLYITVENPYKEGGVAHRATNRIALDNIRQRLELQFDAEAKLQCSGHDGVWKVEIQTPLITQPPPTNKQNLG